MRTLLLLFILFCGTAHGQVIGRGYRCATIGMGIGTVNYQLRDDTGNFVSPRSNLLHVTSTLEYCFSHWLSVSLMCNGSRHLSGEIASGKGGTLDCLPTVHLHAPWQFNQLDLEGTAGYGISYCGWQPGSRKAGASGSATYLGLGLRWLFSADGQMGLAGWYRYSIYNYSRGAFTDPAGNTTKFHLEGAGINFGISFFMRFQKKDK